MASWALLGLQALAVSTAAALPNVCVRASFCEPISSVVHKTWGEILCQAGASSSFSGSKAARAQPFLCTVAGTLQEGSDGAEEVIGFVEASKAPREGAIVDATPLFKKPATSSFDTAARLPHALLSACAALEELGLRDADAAKGAQPAYAFIRSVVWRLMRVSVLVAGGIGSSLVVQARAHSSEDLLQRRGAHPIVLGKADGLSKSTRNDITLLDPRHPGFADELSHLCASRPVRGVIDVIGNEDDVAELQELWGLSYVSLAPASLCRLISDGALGALALAARGAQRDGECVWSADSAASSALRSSLSLIEAGSLDIPSALTWRSMGAGNELLQQLDEYLRWPRDIDSSRRSGFPGRDQWAAPESVGMGRPTKKVQSESADSKFIE